MPFPNSDTKTLQKFEITEDSIPNKVKKVLVQQNFFTLW